MAVKQRRVPAKPAAVKSTKLGTHQPKLPPDKKRKKAKTPVEPVIPGNIPGEQVVEQIPLEQPEVADKPGVIQKVAVTLGLGFLYKNTEQAQVKPEATIADEELDIRQAHIVVESQPKVQVQARKVG